MEILRRDRFSSGHIPEAAKNTERAALAGALVAFKDGHRVKLAARRVNACDHANKELGADGADVIARLRGARFYTPVVFKRVRDARLTVPSERVEVFAHAMPRRGAETMRDDGVDDARRDAGHTDVLLEPHTDAGIVVVAPFPTVYDGFVEKLIVIGATEQLERVVEREADVGVRAVGLVLVVSGESPRGDGVVRRDGCAKASVGVWRRHTSHGANVISASSMDFATHVIAPCSCSTFRKCRCSGRRVPVEDLTSIAVKTASV